MRAVPALILVLATACGRGSNDHEQRSDPAGSGSSSKDRDQARFDTERRPDKVIEALRIRPGARVADVGANTGQLTVHVARAVSPGGQVVATDLDTTVLDELHARVTAAGVASVVETRVVAPDRPGLEPGPYDAILLAEVDHLLCATPPCSSQDVGKWLAEAIQLLKPTGRLVITNKLQLRASSLATMRAAGLVLESDSTPTPSHFLATFVRKAK